MATKKFSREFLREELGLPWRGDVIEDNVVDNDRWSIDHELIFRNPKDEKIYRCWYSVGATEMQDEQPWEYDTTIECEEVELRIKQVECYVSVDEKEEKTETGHSDESAEAFAALEFLKQNRSSLILKDVFDCLTVDEVMARYSPKGIVSRVAEYTASKENSKEENAGNAAENHSTSTGPTAADEALYRDVFGYTGDFYAKVPEKFVEKFLEKANEYFEEKNMPYLALFTTKDKSVPLVTITPKEGSDISSSPYTQFELAPFFAFYKKKKDAGEKKPMKKTVEHMIEYSKQIADYLPNGALVQEER